MSPHQEDYLKAIYEDVKRFGHSSNKSLAEELGHAPASVTGMVKRLVEEGLIRREKTKILLTNEGTALAEELLRRHRLWEVFLVKTLGYDPDEVHPLAEELEHVSDKRLLDRLDDFLHHPACCPHGSPILGRGTGRTLSLRELNLGKRATISRIDDRHTDFSSLASLGLGLGTEVVRLSEEEFFIGEEKINLSAFLDDLFVEEIP